MLLYFVLVFILSSNLYVCTISFLLPFTDNQTAECATLNCSFNCKLTPQGPTCYCTPGQVPVNVTQCEDFDECSIEGMCDQLCHNTFGSYECSCVSGYVKQKNRCLAVNGKWNMALYGGYIDIHSSMYVLFVHIFFNDPSCYAHICRYNAFKLIIFVMVPEGDFR